MQICCFGIVGVKGIVFTEFLEMVEARYSPALLEDLIDAASAKTCSTRVRFEIFKSGG
jgi:hypothetical protein